MKPETPEHIIKAIQEAPYDASPSKLAQELGVHRNTVLKYRREAREDRHEATKEVRANYAREHTSDALAGLEKLSGIAEAEFSKEPDAQMGTLWLNTLKLRLAIASGQEKPAEFGGLTDEELEQIGRDA